jgi:hypothetical protein
MIGPILQLIAILCGVVMAEELYNWIDAEVAAWMIAHRKQPPAEASSSSAIELRKPSFEILVGQSPSGHERGGHEVPD